MDREAFQSIIRGNASEREHLEKLAAGLSEKDLTRPLAAGWTVAAVLAHLAFWDLRAITLIEQWKRSGVGDSPIDEDVVNEAARELCLAIPGRKAAQLAVETAGAIDRVIEQLTPELADRIKTTGKAVRLKRFEHRKSHLGDIERALGRGTGIGA